MYYNTKMNKLQDQSGYAAIMTLILILGVITIIGFVVEVGRMLEFNARLANGTDAAARGGAVQYGKTVSKVYKEEFEKLIPTISPLVEEELAGETEEDIKKETNKRINEELQDKVGEFKNKAQSDCKNKSQMLLSTYKLLTESIKCSESEVEVKAYISYSPVVTGYTIPGTIFRKEAKQEVYINTQ